MKSAIVRPVSFAPAEPEWKFIFTEETEQDAAHQNWLEIVRELADAERLATVNGHMIKRLVCARVFYDGALVALAEQGLVVKSKRGADRTNAWRSALVAIGAVVTELEGELMLSPRRRSGGGRVPRRAGLPTRAAGYLGKRA